MDELLSHIPKMLTNTDLVKALSVYPEYDENVRNEDDATTSSHFLNLTFTTLPL